MLAMDVWCFSKSTARIDLEKHQTRLHYWGISLCNFGESPLQFWVFLLYTKQTKELIIYSGSAVLLNLVLNIWFFNIWGIVGPAISTVIITCMLSVIMLFRSGQLLKTRVSELINVKQMLTILVEIIICGIIAYQIQIRFMDRFSSIITFCLTFVIYGTPLLLLNFKRVLALLKGINSVKMQ